MAGRTNEQTARAIFVNAVVISHADGVSDPRERALIWELKERVGISDAQAERWYQEALSDRRLQAIEDREYARACLHLLTSISQADDLLGGEEQQVLCELARVLGLTQEELERAVEEGWGKRARAALFLGSEPLEAPVALVCDSFDDIERFVAACPSIELARITGNGPGRLANSRWVVFHVSRDRTETLARLTALQRAFSRARFIAILARHQGAQASYALEAGVYRCLVEPVYRGELRRIIEQGRAERGRPG